MHTIFQLKMGHKVLIAISLFCCVNPITEAFGEVLYFEEPLVEIDVCQQICSNKQLNLNDESTKQCERGCRFFNIAMNTNWSAKGVDLNVTKDQCDKSCSDAYSWQNDANCIMGCSEMMQLQKDAWLYYIEQHGDKIQVEVSLISDPALEEQNFGENGVYKIPQTYLRSMPIQPELTEIVDEKSWTPCTHTNDIPRWVVGLIAAVLIVITVYVSYLLPSRPDNSLLIEPSQLETGFGDPDRCNHREMMKLLSGMYVEKPCIKKADGEPEAEDKLVTVNEFFIEDFHANVVPPPKYSLYADCEDV